MEELEYEYVVMYCERTNKMCTVAGSRQSSANLI